MADTYRCEACRGTFDKGWTDAEAEAEGLRVFGITLDDPEAVLVCDDCYRMMGLK